MNKTLTSVLLAAVAAFAFTACGGGQPAAAPVATDFNKCMKEGQEAPKWVCKPFLMGGLVGLGMAEKSPAGLGFQRDEAMAEARKDLAQQLGVKVKTMFKNFTQVSGKGEGAAVDKVASSVQKQIANQNLVGSKAIDSWDHSNGSMYILMSLDPAVAAKVAKEQVQSSLKNEKALWQQFQGKKAQAELDKEIDKEMAAAAQPQ